MMYRRLRTLRAREVRGCTAAFDASRAGTMFDATSGGSPVAPDGQVARWESDADGAHHATQATAGNRPIYRRRGLNGQPCLESTGSSACHLITAAYYPSAGSAAVTMLTVCESESNIFASVAWQYGQNVNAGRFELAPKIDTFSAFGALGGYVGRNSAPEAFAPTVCVVAYPQNGNLSSIDTRWLGASAVYDNTLIPSIVPAIGTGEPLRLMNEITATWRVRRFAAFAAWDRQLGRAVIMRIEQSAMRKWRMASARV